MSVKTESPPEQIRRRPILRREIWDRVHRDDKNYMCIICGETGGGKSMFGLRVCELLDPEFSVDQVAFELDDFMRLVEDRSYGEGSAILFDEVGVALDAATHYDENQLKINRILQTWREQNRILVMTAPHIHLIQKKSRGLLHGQFDMKNIDRDYYLSTAFYRGFSQDTDTGEIWKKNPRLRDPDDHRTKQFQTVSLFKPSPELVKPYNEKKVEFNDQLNEQVRKDVTPDHDDAMDPKDVAMQIADGEIGQYISIHSQNKKPYINEKLIRSDFALSQNDAAEVKSLLRRQFSQAELESAI